MAAPKRTKEQIDHHRMKIAKFYLQGMAQTDIAEKLSIPRSIVVYDLEVLRKEWLESSLMDFNQRKAEELAKIDRLEVTYWDAWKRSLKKRTKKIVEHMPTKVDEDDLDDRGRLDNDALESSPIAKIKVTREKRDGNSTFLAGVQWCIQKRCQILGFDAPIKQEIKTDLNMKTYQCVSPDDWDDTSTGDNVSPHTN